MSLILLSLLFSFITLSLSQSRQCCQPGQSCWPSLSEIDEVSTLLNYDSSGTPISRSYWWPGEGSPYPGPVGTNTPILVENQPIYGQGRTLTGFYSRDLNTPATDVCFENGYLDEFCFVSMRNNPMSGWMPAFVGWPVNTAQVQLLINFARNNSLCVCVLGTGHDFLNRHSCNNGLLIRTSLLKSKEWQPADNTIKVGSGLTWHEAHQFTSEQNRMVVSGWSPTVGIAGWSLGGGHGPYNPKYGLGADNLVELEVVTSEGKIVIANNMENSDLWQALRGGGGSAFGVVTSMTIQTHPLPVGGFTEAILYLSGDYCTGEAQITNILSSYLNWTIPLDNNWGGLGLFITNLNGSGVPPACSNNWVIYIVYHYLGNSSDPTFIQTWQKLFTAFPETAYEVTVSYKNPWDLFVSIQPEVITPIGYLEPNPAANFDGSAPSVMVNRGRVINQDLMNTFRKQYAGCNQKNDCPSYQVFQDVTGNINSPQDSKTSVNPGMRSSLYHIIFGDNSQDFYELGDYSYFGECAFDMVNWQARLWGESNYIQLLRVKEKYDPINLFNCRHCVGDSTP